MILVIAIGITCVALVGNLLPRSYSIRSTIEIEKPVADVFPLVNELQNWKLWSPWGQQAGLEVAYTGELAGEGAVQTWKDPRGDGKLWLTESQPNKLVAYKMTSGNFPEMESQFEFETRDENSFVTWVSEGELPPGAFYGYFSFLFAPGMQAEYDRALTRLKSECESK